jgi:hypothetical protein
VIDVVEQINSVERRVGTRTFDAGEARTVVIARTYEAPLEDVWDACTNPERIPRWFLPVSGELRAGRRYRIELRLSEAAVGRTLFELEHIAPDDDDHWAQFGPGAVGVGWDMALLGLTSHVSTGASADPAAFAAWTASDEGKEFVTISSRCWGDAAIEAGEAPDTARAAAERTAGFYTGTGAG